jgi:hypothetical protein
MGYFHDKKINKYLFLTLTISVVFLTSLFFYYANINFIEAQNNSPDAIAIRVVNNPDHFSALNWYRKQNFKGSPQSLVIDGYEAIRDGRTVYVNAGNTDGINLYTGIYIISYNQAAEDTTVDIFGQILSHWQFNSNLTAVGRCSTADRGCLADNE